MVSVFTYGTLMFEPVWSGLLGRSQAVAVSATIDGFARYRVINEIYPAMIRAPGERLSGVVYSPVSDDELAILDAFEGVDYQRIAVDVVLDHDEAGERVSCFAYQCVRPDTLEFRPWEPDQFSRLDMHGFMTDRRNRLSNL